MNVRIFLTGWLIAFAGAAFGQGASLTDQARFLAGLPVQGSALEHHTRNPFWMEHATAFDRAWSKQLERQVARVSAWSRRYIPEAHGSGGTVYYMFSGPDFLYAHTFFPNASTYILCGTEPVGNVPDITTIPPEQLGYSLQALRQSMNTMLSFHYFITKEMRVDLNRLRLGGTLPVLYVFLARTGHTVREVSHVKNPAPGVRIVFSRGGGREQALYYFKTDLSNGGGSGSFFRWCAQQGPGLSLLKAASYLPHSDGFSGVRNFLLQNSRLIVQDDSGIPLRHFDRERWAMRFFGNYAGPIDLFAKHHQPDLAQAYQASNPADLGFAFGYHWQTERGLLIVAGRR
jgi:hypothetical protein